MRLSTFICLGFFAFPALAEAKVTMVLRPDAPLVAGKEVSVIATLTRDGKPLTFADLKEVHTKKFHLLVIDPSLTDYQHIHPTAGKKPGEFVFDFTPHTKSMYRAWADITPLKGEHEYVVADMGEGAPQAAIDKKTVMQSSKDGLDLALAFDGPLKSGEATMGSVVVSKDGKPFDKLEPVMGAFAHIVAFSQDFRSILHVHPMGKEPEKESERGGPELSFHVEPHAKGFVKLFVQLRVDGKDVFVPFGVQVQ